MIIDSSWPGRHLRRRRHLSTPAAAAAGASSAADSSISIMSQRHTSSSSSALSGHHHTMICAVYTPLTSAIRCLVPLCNLSSSEGQGKSSTKFIKQKRFYTDARTEIDVTIERERGAPPVRSSSINRRSRSTSIIISRRPAADASLPFASCCRVRALETDQQNVRHL